MIKNSKYEGTRKYKYTRFQICGWGSCRGCDECHRCISACKGWKKKYKNVCKWKGYCTACDYCKKEEADQTTELSMELEATMATMAE